MTKMALRPDLVEPVAPAVLAETRAFNAQLERLLAGSPSVADLPVEQTRRLRREGLGLVPGPDLKRAGWDLIGAGWNLKRAG
jgi:hypothetical protein